MSEVQGLSAAKVKMSCIFLAVGAVVLACGIYMGNTNDNGTFIAIVLLSSVALFAAALLPFLNLHGFRIFHDGKVADPATQVELQSKAKVEIAPESALVSQPDANAGVPSASMPEVKPEAKTEPHPGPNTDAHPTVKTEARSALKSDVQADGSAEIQPELKAEAKPAIQAMIDPEPVVKSGNQAQTRIDANSDIAKLMNTSLGELLLTALIKDPERAGGLIAHAIRRAGEA